jgi:K+-sensing histidine kinase KdpD
MADLVATLADQYSRQWSDRKVSVRKEAAATRVMADPELLQLALRQLLDNACKYSVPGSAVTVSIDSQADWVAIRTSNSGSFIRQSERSRIFERFYREQRRVIRRLVRGWVYTLRGRSFMHTAGAWNSTLE